MTKKARGRPRNPKAAQSKYTVRAWMLTTPDAIVFIDAVKALTGAPNRQEVFNDMIRSYHREWMKKDPSRIPPLTRKKRDDGD